MLLRSGLLFAFAAVFLQIAVFLQPLLPQQYQIAPVCETITLALLQTPVDHKLHEHAALHTHHAAHEVGVSHHDHDAGHQCQYCTVYSHLVLPPNFDLQEVLERIQIRLLALQKAYASVWFVLQRLFLMPQGRAPPQFA